MGFSVPPRLRLERWALAPPFHPCLRFLRNTGGLSFFGTVRRQASRPGRPRVSPFRLLTSAGTRYAASRPFVFWLFIGRAHLLTPLTLKTRMPSSSFKKKKNDE